MKLTRVHKEILKSAREDEWRPTEFFQEEAKQLAAEGLLAIKFNNDTLSIRRTPEGTKAL